MKKSSILVTLFLVVALVFAVSCPNKSPTLKVTSPTGTDATIPVTVGQEKEIPIKLELANDAFVATTVKTDVDLTDWFTLSDGTTTAKAEKVSVLVSKVYAAESTTKADGDAKLVIVELTLKVKAIHATEASKLVTVAIKVPAEKDNVKYTESGKEITATANDIKITITDKSQDSNPDPVKDKVTADVGGEAAAFLKDTADTTKKVTVTLSGGTFANINGINVFSPNGVTSAHFSYKYEIDTDKRVLNITVKSTAEIAEADKGIYNIYIPASAISADSKHIEKDLSLDLQVFVAEQYEPTPSWDGTVNIKFKPYEASDNLGWIGLSLHASDFIRDKLNKIKIFPPDGADKDHISFSEFSFYNEDGDIRTTVSCTADVNENDVGEYTIHIPAEAMQVKDRYKDRVVVPPDGLTFVKYIGIDEATSN